MERSAGQKHAPLLNGNDKPPGKVFLVGAGPGDPELITVKGLRLLKQADAVLFDRLVNPQLLRHCTDACQKIYVGKDPCGDVSQETINRWMIAAAQKYSVVVRLKSGDPFIFGRGGEEIAALEAAGIDWEVVAGVSSAIAAPAAAGIPVLHRRMAHSLMIVSGHSAGGKCDLSWTTAAAAADTLVILMGVGPLRGIVDSLIGSGKPPSTPVAIVQEATRPGQKVFTGTLDDIVERSADVRSPAVIVIGQVAALAEACRRVGETACRRKDVRRYADTPIRLHGSVPAR